MLERVDSSGGSLCVQTRGRESNPMTDTDREFRYQSQ